MGGACGTDARTLDAGLMRGATCRTKPSVGTGTGTAWIWSHAAENTCLSSSMPEGNTDGHKMTLCQINFPFHFPLASRQSARALSISHNPVGCGYRSWCRGFCVCICWWIISHCERIHLLHLFCLQTCVRGITPTWGSDKLEEYTATQRTY